MPRKNKRVEDDREDEREFLGKFVAELEKANTLLDAAVVRDGPIMRVSTLPFTGNVGRGRRSSLQHFLGGFESTGGQPSYRVQPGYPIVPAGATLAERNAYSRLVMRFAE